MMGGGISTRGEIAGNFTLDGVVMTNHDVSTLGGAMEMQSAVGGHIEIYNSRFANNEGGLGGES